jgi:hypothetical protein
VYEPALQQCDPSRSPEEIWYVTTRYSPAVEPLQGYTLVRSERVGVAEIKVYRRA